MQRSTLLFIPFFILFSYTTHGIIHLTVNYKELLTAFGKKSDFYKSYWCAMCFIYIKAKEFKRDNEYLDIQLNEYPGKDLLLTDDIIILNIDGQKARFFSPVGGFTLESKHLECIDYITELVTGNAISYQSVGDFVTIQNLNPSVFEYPFLTNFNLNTPGSMSFNLLKVNENGFPRIQTKDESAKAVVFNYARLPSPGSSRDTRANWLTNILIGFSGKEKLTFDNQSAEH